MHLLHKKALASSFQEIFNNPHEVLASASSDGTIRLWEVDTGFPVNILRAHAVWVWHLQFAPESRFFASGGADTRIFLWDYAQPQPLLVQ